MWNCSPNVVVEFAAVTCTSVADPSACEGQRPEHGREPKGEAGLWPEEASAIQLCRVKIWSE